MDIQVLVMLMLLALAIGLSPAMTVVEAKVVLNETAAEKTLS